MSNVITRFAPSPTGFLHIGGVRTALFNYLFAKQNQGNYILRIEDTDKERNREEWVEALVDDLSWLGLKHDSFARQSERGELYVKMLKNLIENGFAYEAEESQKGSGKIIRFKNPNKKISFNDLIRGEVTFDTTDLGDFIIARSIEEPLYHLAVVIDDADMKVTHVIRAEEHLSNTPRQILMQEALGFERPIYAHLPLVLAPDRSKLSKRKHGETVSLTYYRKSGYLPEAIINFVALLGWNPGDDREIFSIEELIKEFDLKKIQKGGAILNVEKLDWLNAQYIKKLAIEEKMQIVKNNLIENKKSHWQLNVLKGERKMTEVIVERIKKWSDIKTLIERGEIDYLFEKPTLDKELIAWPKDKDKKRAADHLDAACQLINDLQDEVFDDKMIKSKIWPYAEKEGKGSVLWPLRYTLSGKEQSPDPFSLSEILGKKETLERWKKAKEELLEKK